MKERGFTLVELLVAIAISLIVMTGIYQVWRSSQKSYLTQEQGVAMSQNLRASMDFMEKDIRQAGCDPKRTKIPGIKDMGWDTSKIRFTSIRFTMDITGGETDGKDNDGDGFIDETEENKTPEWYNGNTNDMGEDITYRLDANNNLLRDDHTLPPAPPEDLEKMPIVAENIDAIDFVYLKKDFTPASLSEINEIRSVEVTVVARANKKEKGYVDNVVYKNQQGTVILPAQNDNFRRKILSTRIACRNLGM